MNRLLSDSDVYIDGDAVEATFIISRVLDASTVAKVKTRPVPK